MLEKFQKIKLGHFPTPIEHLKNITKIKLNPVKKPKVKKLIYFFLNLH